MVSVAGNQTILNDTGQRREGWTQGLPGNRACRVVTVAGCAGKSGEMAPISLSPLSQWGGQDGHCIPDSKPRAPQTRQPRLTGPEPPGRSGDTWGSAGETSMPGHSEHMRDPPAAPGDGSPASGPGGTTLLTGARKLQLLCTKRSLPRPCQTGSSGPGPRSSSAVSSERKAERGRREEEGESGGRGRGRGRPGGGRT